MRHREWHEAHEGHAVHALLVEDLAARVGHFPQPRDALAIHVQVGVEFVDIDLAAIGGGGPVVQADDPRAFGGVEPRRDLGLHLEPEIVVTGEILDGPARVALLDQFRLRDPRLPADHVRVLDGLGAGRDHELLGGHDLQDDLGRVSRARHDAREQAIGTTDHAVVVLDLRVSQEAHELVLSEARELLLDRLRALLPVDLDDTSASREPVVDRIVEHTEAVVLPEHHEVGILGALLGLGRVIGTLGRKAHRTLIARERL